MQKEKINEEVLNYDESSLKSVNYSINKQSINTESNEDLKEKLLVSRLSNIFSEYMLSEVQCLAAFKVIKDKVGDRECKDVQNLRKWILMKINKKPYPETIHKLQLGCPDVVPGLTVKAWWDPNDFLWIQELMKNFDIIKKELIELRNNTGFQPYKSPSYANEKNKSEDKLGSYANDSGQWNVFYLFLHDMKFEENCKKCPTTVNLIEKYVPRQYHHAFFSAVTPGTHIVSHNGPTNRKLRMHIPLMNVEGSRLRAGEETKELQEGLPIIFDDSFNHESWHNGDKTRINLILDFWHPDLSDLEVKFFKMLQQSRLRRHGRKILEDLGKGAEDDNYFAIIEKSKEILKNNDWWVG